MKPSRHHFVYFVSPEVGFVPSPIPPEYHCQWHLRVHLQDVTKVEAREFCDKHNKQREQNEC